MDSIRKGVIEAWANLDCYDRMVLRNTQVELPQEEHRL